MIRSITQKKPEEEIERLLKGLNRVFIIGCGTCVTLTASLILADQAYALSEKVRHIWYTRQW